MHVHEPAIQTAAALIIHWSRLDVEAVVIMMADIADQEEAEDIITALLQLRDRDIEDVRKLVLHG